MENTENPYKAPASRVDDVDVPAALRPAGRGRRLLTFFIDYIVFSVGIGFVFGAASVIWGDAVFAAIEKVPDILLGVIVMMLYYVPLEGLFGRTLGKLIVGTRVVNETGGAPSFQQILIRSLCRFIPFEAFSFFGKDARGWHDSIPRTHVVLVR